MVKEKEKIMKKEKVSTVARSALFVRTILTFVLIASLMFALLMPAEAQPPQKGPRAPGVTLNFYTTRGAAFTALDVTGEIDVMKPMLTASQFAGITNPAITLCGMTTYTVYGEAIQSNYTVRTDQDTYWGVRNPMNHPQFRKAVMHLVNKTNIVNNIYGGHAERIDVPIAAPSRAWWNTSLTGDNYPYPFSISDAIAHLEGGICSTHGYIPPEESAGFVDHDGNGIRNYPIGWPGAPLSKKGRGKGKPVDMLPLQYWIYDDPPEIALEAGDIALQLAAVGIPVAQNVASHDVVLEKCWMFYDYHLATDRWSVERYPTYLWNRFASYFWMPNSGGSNAYTGGDDEPWAAEVDAAVEGIKFAPDVTTAKTSCLYAQYLIVDKHVLWIPVFSEKGFYAYKDLVGGTKYYGNNFWNFYTSIKASRATNPTLPIRVGTSPSPLSINPIYARDESFESIWEMIASPSILSNPFDPMIEQPGVLQDWDQTTWIDGITTKSKVTRWLSRESSWIEPGTGNVLDPLTTAGYEFGAWYMYQTPEARRHADYKYINHIRLHPADTSKVEVFFDRQGWLFYLDAMSTNFGIYAVREGEGFKQAPIATKETKIFVEGPGGNATTPGDLPLPWRTIGAPVEIVSIKQDGVLLTPAVIGSDNDYEILNGRIHIYKDIPNGAKIEAIYWARGNATGYTAGGLPWQETLIGTGAFYMTFFDGTTGASFNANRNFFLETPPLGEIDWYWWWIVGPKPRDGYMEVRIYDAVVVFGAFDSQGHPPLPDPQWTPSADIAPPVGKIDNLDVNTVIHDYSMGIGFWSPPPNPPP